MPGEKPPETEAERIDRNWSELLQELRVAQTGTQILTGFLLTIPFQQRFGELDGGQRIIYLVLVAFSALATILALAPVSLHRTLFRQGAKPEIVAVTNRLLIGTLACVAVTLTGTVLLVFDVVVGLPEAITAGAVTAVLTAVAWLMLPRVTKRRG